MQDDATNSQAVPVPRLLIELREGGISRIVSDQPVSILTIDPAGSASNPQALGLVASGADEILSRRDFDRLLRTRFDRLLDLLSAPPPPPD
ncbi:hypothetical protein [Aestuariispira ectoiniformans]|uniref:hypothetical protein n=1 Tax=Aestuariispira ectoiniformans TaxID=2775080 RepID=UPI00223BF1F7|nr:hypothetical protein [Aestuariispira ectoiniformans]